MGFYEALDRYLLERYNYKKNVVLTNESCNGTTIEAKRKRFNLYFRWISSSEFWGTDIFVIARINFHETRVGHGTDLLKFICDQSAKLNIKNVGIEMTNLQSAAFAKYHGFNQVNERNWIIDIETLQRNLNHKSLAQS